jgi:MFS transporter, DHA2 family, multidrug resistance protein
MSGTAGVVAAPAAPAAQNIPWLGLAAVLLGTFVSTLTGRLSTFGLTDVRGALHAGFDDGAWITTSFTVAQMLVTPFAVWVGAAYGPRQILILSALVFAAASFLLPFSQNLDIFLGLQFIAGLSSGCFIPLTLSFVLRSMPPRLWAYGVAIYALNLELSLNISASLEGFYVDYASWHWIFWQNVPLALGMAACLHWGVRRQPPTHDIHWDLYGLTACGVGFALLYAALDQGNRLDWLNSGLISGLLLAGGIMLVAFVIHEATASDPWLDPQVPVRWPMPLLLLLISILRLTIQSTAVLIPYYLGAVRGFRALEVGDTLIWIALPQLLTCLIAAWLLRRFDPRLTAGLGMCLVGVACMTVAWTLTPVWGSDQFLVSQLLQALGQSLALSGVVFNAVLNLRPQDALSFGASLQIARLFGGEVGASLITTWDRVREQRASNLIGLHVQKGALDVQRRLADYQHVLMSRGHSTAAPAVLGDVVRVMATTQSAIDGFVLVAVVAALGFTLFVLIVPPPPQGPASHVPLFRRKSAP